MDTVPISDKLWAWKAGLGWIGKNTLLVNPVYGSFCFLAELVTSMETDLYDKPMENRCGDCEACLRACPNHALVPAPSHPREGDEACLVSTLCAERCTSYNTIENRAATLPESLNRQGYAFGCDFCQQACPYNREAPISEHLTAERIAELRSIFSADETTYRRLTRHSPISRVKYSQWIRNLRK